VDAIAAARRAVTLEADNWRHHIRLSYVSWGEERLRAAQRTLALLPAFPLAHWLAATVHVARQTLVEAERELQKGLDALAGQSAGDVRFNAVALHWLMGLVALSLGNESRALEELELELSSLPPGHLYARECTANTWYAIGALRLRQRRRDEARAAFDHAIEHVPAHPMAGVVLASLETSARQTIQPRSRFDAAFLQAIQHAMAGDHDRAARIVEDALESAPAGNAGWTLPVEPLLGASQHPEVWARALALVRRRAA
jgi:tetratricopeptide (TPR) repeat protein